MQCCVVVLCSITQQLSGASRGHKARLIHGQQKRLEWSLPEVLAKTEESAHFKVWSADYICISQSSFSLQCFDAVGWVAGRASDL